MHDITSYGAVADGRTVNTQAIQAALDACGANGGGTVLVPTGIFVSGSLWLRDNTELHLASGAVLLGSDNLDDYNKDDAFPQNMRSEREQWNGAHLILAVEVRNVSITGPGCIDGCGDAFYEEGPPAPRRSFAWTAGLRKARDKPRLRPGQMVFFCECRGVRLHQVFLRNASCWTCLLYGCEDVQVSGLRIENPPDAGNTDGIDIDCCRRVCVSDCIITTGDDALTLRANPQRLSGGGAACEDIVISNCVLDTSVCAFRIGVGCGVIRHAAISNIVVRRAATGLLFQSAYSPSSRGVDISGITVDNIQLHEVAHPIRVLAGAQSATAVIEDIRIHGMHGRCHAGCEFSGNPQTRPRRVTLSDIDLCIGPCPLPSEPDNHPESFLHFSRVDDMILDRVRIRWDKPSPRWRRAVQSIEASVHVTDTCELPEPGCGDARRTVATDLHSFRDSG